jgi:putative ATPase
MARMISGGEDPLYVARRLVRMAAEDIGLADPRALSIALAAKETYHFLGSPEGEIALAEAAIYLATAPKSNRVCEAWSQALTAAKEHPAEPVPPARLAARRQVVRTDATRVREDDRRAIGLVGGAEAQGGRLTAP